MKFALNCRTVAKDTGLWLLLDAAAEAGFDGVEVRIADASREAAKTSWNAVIEGFGDRGLIPASFIDGIPPGLVGEDAVFEEALNAWQEQCWSAERLGCRLATVILNPRSRLARERALEVARARLERLCKIGADHGVSIAVEVLGVKEGLSSRLDGPQFVADSLSDGLRLIADVGASNLGVVFDAYHWYVAGGTMEEVDAAAQGAVRIVHVNDAPKGDPGVLSDAERLLPGDGVLPWPKFAAVLDAGGFDGFFSVEVFRRELWELPPREAARRARSAIKRAFELLSPDPGGTETA